MSVIETRYRTEMADIFSDENRIKKWAEVELALVKAHAKLGNIPKEAVPAVLVPAVSEIRLLWIISETVFNSAEDQSYQRKIAPFFQLTHFDCYFAEGAYSTQLAETRVMR